MNKNVPLKITQSTNKRHMITVIFTIYMPVSEWVGV